MTNGEKIQTILDVDKDCTEVHGENGTMTFTVTQNWWNAEYKEPTTKNDLGVDCISRDDVRDVMQELWGTSGELMDRLMALPSVTPQEPILEKINKMKSEIASSLEFWDYSPNNNPLARDILETVTHFWGDIREVDNGNN